MKVSHDYFHKYNTRRVNFKQSTGLFVVDGAVLPRDLVEDETQDKRVSESYKLKSTSGHGTSLSNYEYGTIDSSIFQDGLLLNQSQYSTRRSISTREAQDYNLRRSAFSPPRNVIYKAARLNAMRVGTPVYEVMEKERPLSPNSYYADKYYSRMKTAEYEVVEDQRKTIHEAKADFHNHIYQDNNYRRIYDEYKTVNETTRLWNKREKSIRSLQNAWTSEVVTEVPNNKKVLGLTPLRANGNGQDKPHHIPVGHNVVRFRTKIT
jgi:hypothetical protein